MVKKLQYPGVLELTHIRIRSAIRKRIRPRKNNPDLKKQIWIRTRPLIKERIWIRPRKKQSRSEKADLDPDPTLDKKRIQIRP